MYNPRSTYRIQFNKEFTFRHFLDRIEYFALLGTGAIYASPVFAATTGSMHGYDVTDPLRFNYEIGSGYEFDEIVTRLNTLEIGWIQDIVPNHMAFHYENRWCSNRD
jgi:maltooligosyltrehalose synthase